MPIRDPVKRRAYQNERNRAKAAGNAPAPLPASVPVTNPAERFFQWTESSLKVPTGPLRGRPFTIPEWQRKYIREALAEGVREAGLSIARKNGKSGLIAALMLCYLIGPLNEEFWRGLVVSLTGNLAKELRDAIQFTAEVSGMGDKIRVLRSPPPGKIEGLRGSRLDILASDRSSGHAVGGDLVVIDEAGLLPESERGLWAAVMSSMSGRDGRLLAISIRGDGPMFAEMQTRADGRSVRFVEHAAPADAAIDDRAGWLRANPGLASGIKSASYMEDMARKALASPADQAAFRSHDLNQPQAPSRELIVSLSDWKGIVVLEDDFPPREGVVVLGLDIGGSSSMTCATAIWPYSGRMETWGGYGDEPPLAARSEADNTNYVEMFNRGELRIYEGRITPVAAFVRDVLARLAGEAIIAAGADRYKREELRTALTIAEVNWPMSWFIMGKGPDASFVVRAFQRSVLGGTIKTRESLMLASAISESTIKRDPNGNEGLDKSRARGRIDALSSATIAAGLAERVLARPQRDLRSFTM